jgi:hypothetical protein
MLSAPRYKAAPKILLTELPDGTGVLLSLETKFYYTVNRTGVLVWRTLENGAVTKHEIARALAERYDVGDDQAGQDVTDVLDDLIAEKLVELIEDPS